MAGVLAAAPVFSPGWRPCRSGRWTGGWKPDRCPNGRRLGEDEANFLAETVRRGGAVVSVRAAESHVPAIEKIMDGTAPIDMDTRRAEYQREGWTRFDEQAGTYQRSSCSELS